MIDVYKKVVIEGEGYVYIDGLPERERVGSECLEGRGPKHETFIPTVSMCALS